MSAARITAASLADAATIYAGNKWELWKAYKIAKRRAYSNHLSHRTKASYKAAADELFTAFANATRSA